MKWFIVLVKHEFQPVEVAVTDKDMPTRGALLEALGAEDRFGRLVVFDSLRALVGCTGRGEDMASKVVMQGACPLYSGNPAQLRELKHEFVSCPVAVSLSTLSDAAISSLEMLANSAWAAEWDKANFGNATYVTQWLMSLHAEEPSVDKFQEHAATVLGQCVDPDDFKVRNCAGVAVALKNALVATSTRCHYERNHALEGVAIDVHLVLAPMSADVTAKEKQLFLTDEPVDPSRLRYDHACVLIPFLKKAEGGSDGQLSVLFLDTNSFDKPVVIVQGAEWLEGLEYNGNVNVVQCNDYRVIQGRVKEGAVKGAFVYDMLSPRQTPSLSSTSLAHGGVARDSTMLVQAVTAVEILFSQTKTLFVR